MKDDGSPRFFFRGHFHIVLRTRRPASHSFSAAYKSVCRFGGCTVIHIYLTAMHAFFQRVGLEKPPDPKEQVRSWQSKLRSEMRAIERQCRDIAREEKSVEKEIKACGKRGDVKSAKMLAREVVNSRNVQGKLYSNRARLLSMSNALTEQLATIRAVKSIGKSTEIMRLMNECVKIPQMTEAMRDMSREMAKAGMIDDIVESAFEAEDADLEEESEEAVNKVLAEIGLDTLAAMPAAGTSNLPQTQVAEQQEVQEEEEKEDADVEALQARLNAVRA